MKKFKVFFSTGGVYHEDILEIDDNESKWDVAQEWVMSFIYLSCEELTNASD